MYLLGFLTVVMHASNNNTDRYRDLVPRAQDTWLRGLQHVIVHGGTGPAKLTLPSTPFPFPVSPLQGHRRLLSETDGGVFVSSPDNPGCGIKKIKTHKGEKYIPSKDCESAIKTPSLMMQYPGAQRTLVGILAANDTFPNTAWTLVVDDDNMVKPTEVAMYLSHFDPDKPFLLAGRLGPSRARPACAHAASDLGSSTSGKWACCYGHQESCRVPNFQASGVPQAVYRFNHTSKSVNAPEPCRDLTMQCCRSSPWPEGAPFGYPYRAHPHGSYRPHFLMMWPYGGNGYVLSRGLLREIGREYLKECIERIQCGNADMRLMTCILNKGYSFHHTCVRVSGIGKCKPGETAIPGIKHHVYDLERDCVNTFVQLQDKKITGRCIPRNGTWTGTTNSEQWLKFRSSPFGERTAEEAVVAS